VEPARVAAAGRVLITIHGQNFGPAAPAALSVAIGDELCAHAAWVDSGTLTCEVPADLDAGTVDVSARVDAQLASMRSALTLEPPVITDVHPASAAAVGGQTVSPLPTRTHARTRTRAHTPPPDRPPPRLRLLPCLRTRLGPINCR
jgi:hypothetical protein